MHMHTFTQSSDLAASALELLATLSIAGVNAELRPLVSMTVPEQWLNTPISDWPVQQHLFKSWILLFGILPIDLHDFYLHAVDTRSGFAEKSSSLINAQWNHERRITARAGGCNVTDIVAFRCRLPLLGYVLGYLLKPVYRLVFWSRHRNLRSQFGVLPANPADRGL